MKPELSIIIPTKEREKILLATLDSITKNKGELNLEIIVINDSKVESIVFDDEHILVYNNPNQGAASARNYGASIANSDVILFLDDDMLICENVLQEVLSRTIQNQKAIFLPNWKYSKENLTKLAKYNFGRFLIKINYTSLEGWLGKKLENTSVVKHDGMASYFFMIMKSNFNTLGGYNTNFRYAGFEDYDITKRLISDNFEFYILPELILIHNETDRIEIKDWLKRRRRNAFTQRIAVELGYENIKINYSTSKKVYLFIMSLFDVIIVSFVTLSKKLTILDNINFKLINLLTALYIYKGYQHDYKKSKNEIF